ncbi:hypothetical protein AVEN_122743-1 [Araneus ventricosus]|uniref:Uncharacterized protein n=1 Tax=Araneus ventricosus TaxID=182803 RepID=A0A4Y2HVU8_ARAVE|nr:hypothetical protein AVEN_122743-1 [Araneus ventricosus]
MTTLSSIGYVAHVHCFRYENGRMCPTEIGVVQVLPLGIPDNERKTLLVTVKNSDLKMHLADWRANVVVSDKISKLPPNFVGDYTRAEAEQRVREFIPRGSLVAVRKELLSRTRAARRGAENRSDTAVPQTQRLAIAFQASPLTAMAFWKP